MIEYTRVYHHGLFEDLEIVDLETWRRRKKHMNTLPIIVLSDKELDRFLREDVPSLDLTTWALGIGEAPGRITFATRHDTVLCGTEEVVRILEKCGATVLTTMRSGTMLATGVCFLEAAGSAGALHIAWKVCANLLEYLSGIATNTHTMLAAAQSVNPTVQIATTRKSIPGTRTLAIKAVLAGGGMPHRLGLSETVLIFPQHRVFLGGLEGCLQRLANIRRHCPEKKIAIEVETLDEALQVARAGVDILQIDKMAPSLIRETVAAVRSIDPQVCIAAAGGITLANAAEYAATGIDIIVTSSLYTAKPADIAVQITCEE